MHLLNTLPQRLDPGATPTFAGLIAPTLTSPAATNLTLAGGSSGASLVLEQGTNGAVTITPAGTGDINLTSAGSGSFVFVNGGNPILFLNETDQSADARLWAMQGEGGLFKLRAFNDALSSVVDTFAATRTGNLLIGTTDSTGLTGAGGLKIASTTAGASNAGALVVAGGISAGNTGSAASYFGGALTAAGDISLNGSQFAVKSLVFSDTGVTSGFIYSIAADSTYHQLRIAQNTKADDSQFRNTIPSWDLSLGGKTGTNETTIGYKAAAGSWVNLFTLATTGAATLTGTITATQNLSAGNWTTQNTSVIAGGGNANVVTFATSSTNRNYLVTFRQDGNAANYMICLVNTYGSSGSTVLIAQDNTNPVLLMTPTMSGLSLNIALAAGYGSTTWKTTVTPLSN